MTCQNAFTVDVEDYFQVSAFEQDVSRCSWNQYESRVVGNTERLLDLLARYGVRGTFFVLGWVAEHYASLVQRIAAAGHEVGSHSYAHRLVYQMAPEEFRSDLRRSIRLLEDATGAPVNAYRAPSFSITNKSLWALDILVEEGITYDSSIFPVYHDRYGIPGARADIHSLSTSSGDLWEIPPAVYSVWGMRFPVAGGGYFRLYPWWLSQHCLRQLNQQNQPFVFYVHPWEVDPDQPKLSSGTAMSRWRHRVNLQTTQPKLEKLLQRFEFSTLQQLVSDATSSHHQLADAPAIS